LEGFVSSDFLIKNQKKQSLLKKLLVDYLFLKIDAMNLRPFLCIVLFFIFCTGCADKELMDIEDCTKLNNTKRLSEAEKQDACIYLQVYRYQSEIYTVCECCVCDKVAMAVDCDNLPLCEFMEGCMVDFFEDAEYLYSVEEL